MGEETWLFGVYFSYILEDIRAEAIAIWPAAFSVFYKVQNFGETPCLCEEKQTSNAKTLKTEGPIKKTDPSMICVGLSFSISPSFVSFFLFQQEVQEYWVKPNPCFKYWYRSYQASMPFLHYRILKQKGKVFVCSSAIITAERVWVCACV